MRFESYELLIFKFNSTKYTQNMYFKASVEYNTESIVVGIDLKQKIRKLVKPVIYLQTSIQISFTCTWTYIKHVDVESYVVGRMFTVKSDRNMSFKHKVIRISTIHLRLKSEVVVGWQ